MKFLFGIMFLVLNLPGHAQEQQFFDAFRQNDFSSIKSFLGSRLELSILDSQDIYPTDQALKKISTWVKNHKVNGLTLVHGGQSEDYSSHYKVAQISTSEGLFRVFVYVSEESGKNIIKKVQIDAF